MLRCIVSLIYHLLICRLFLSPHGIINRGRRRSDFSSPKGIRRDILLRPICVSLTRADVWPIYDAKRVYNWRRGDVCHIVKLAECVFRRERYGKEKRDADFMLSIWIPRKSFDETRATCFSEVDWRDEHHQMYYARLRLINIQSACSVTRHVYQ